MSGTRGMMATNDAIMRTSSGSFFARTPLALANSSARMPRAQKSVRNCPRARSASFLA